MQKVGRMLIYRATDAADALSVRTIQLVKAIDFASTNQVGELSVLLSNADDGRPVYNRFRVRVENSSGLFSLTDKVLVL